MHPDRLLSLPHPLPRGRRALASGAALGLAFLAACGGGGGGGADDDRARAVFDFVHVTSDENTFLGATVLDHPALNDRPDALPIATAAYSLPDGRPTDVANPSPVALRYTPGNGRWSLINQRAGVLMPVGQAYHVSAYGTGGEGRAIRFAAPTGQPMMHGFDVPEGLVAPTETLLVAPTWWDGAREVGLRCDVLLAAATADARTVVLRRHGDLILAGQHFHGAALSFGGHAIAHVVTIPTLRGPESELSHPLLDERPEAVLQVATHFFSPASPLDDPRALGVAFDAASGRWRLRTDDGSAIRMGSSFTVHVRR